MNLFSRYIFFMISVMYFGSCDSSSSPSEIMFRIDWFETFDGADARLLMNSLLYLKLGLLDDLCFFNWNGLKFYPEMLSCCIFKSSCKLAITSFLWANSAMTYAKSAWSLPFSFSRSLSLMSYSLLLSYVFTSSLVLKTACSFRLFNLASWLSRSSMIFVFFNTSVAYPSSYPLISFNYSVYRLITSSFSFMILNQFDGADFAGSTASLAVYSLFYIAFWFCYCCCCCCHIAFTITLSISESRTGFWSTCVVVFCDVCVWATFSGCGCCWGARVVFVAKPLAY